MKSKAVGMWDGSAESFWEVVDRLRLGEHTESDFALLRDVLRVAMAALETMERLEALGYGEDLAEIAEKDEE